MGELTLYDNYAKLRDKNHMTDYYVSKKTGLNRANFTAWRKGTAKPSRNSLDCLSKFFDVPVNYFYEG